VIGRVLDRRYRILRLLGEGGMGAVWEADQLGTGRRVAVKLIKAEYANHPDIAKRFYREARAVAALRTPHVVQIYDCAQDAETGSPYLVMEMLAGEDVSGLSRRLGFMAPELALRICGQALRGLAAAHAVGIVHRDVKPSNLFLTRSEQGGLILKLLDFGIAKDVGAETKETKLTRTGTPLGSPEYMSPEQISGLRVDHRTDIWSLGAVLYECLTQRSPYEGCETWLQLANSITEGPPRSVQDQAAWVSHDVAAIIYGAMAWITDRYQSADAMMAAIARLVSGLEIHEGMLRPMTLDARRTTGDRFAIKAFAKAATNAGVATGATRPPASPAVPVLIALGVAAAVAVPIVLWRGRTPQAPTPASAELPVASSVAAVAPAVRPSIEPVPKATASATASATAETTPTVAPSVSPSISATATARKPTNKPSNARPPSPQPDGMIKSF
jgi:eukaryotic-like serine/threonine-protein kinase